MRDLVLNAISEILAKAERLVDREDKLDRRINISDVNPKDLISFMERNKIPTDSEFNCFDGEPVLSWYVQCKASEKLVVERIRHYVNTFSFNMVYDTLTNNGYLRVPVDSYQLRRFKDTSVYDMYVVGDYDRLIDYYSLFFNAN